MKKQQNGLSYREGLELTEKHIDDAFNEAFVKLGVNPKDMKPLTKLRKDKLTHALAREMILQVNQSVS